MTLEISLIFGLKIVWVIDYTTRHKITPLWA